MGRKALIGPPSFQTLRKRRYRAHRRRQVDPIDFYAERHRRKHARKLSALAHRAIDPWQALLDGCAEAERLMFGTPC